MMTDPPDAEFDESDSFMRGLDDLFDDSPVLYPPDTRSPEQSQEQEPLTPEEEALWRDLRLYDNPEAFNDPNAEHFALTVLSADLPDLPPVLRVEVLPADLHRTLWQTSITMMENKEDFRDHLIKSLGVADWEEAEAKIAADPEFKKQVDDAYWFFIRNFPRLAIAMYEIGVLMSTVFPFKTAFEPNDPEGNFDRDVRTALIERIRQLHNDIKQMLGTRSSGRPRKAPVPEDQLPSIVVRVLDAVSEMMGDNRGKDAVPGLKTIADKFDLTEDALGKQLIRSGYSWTRLRNYLANRT